MPRGTLIFAIARLTIYPGLFRLGPHYSCHHCQLPFSGHGARTVITNASCIHWVANQGGRLDLTKEPVSLAVHFLQLDLQMQPIAAPCERG